MKHKKTNILTLSVFFLLLTLAQFSGCNPTPGSVNALATKLKNDGVSWETKEKLNVSSIKHAQIDEAISIKGEMLHIDIYRITHKKTFDMMGNAVILLGAAEQKIGQPLPQKPEVYIREPYVIAIRMEPEPGLIKEKLDNLFG